jgi:uncharacterized protein YbbK (DUF523 family)
MQRRHPQFHLEVPPVNEQDNANPETIYLVSACLLGIPTRWDGGNCLTPRLVKLAAEGRAIPFCPEASGGLPIPRPEAELQGGDGHDALAGRCPVVSIEGVDVTSQYLRGARLGLAKAKQHDATAAILKAYSPGCGNREIWNGTFTLTLKPGQGVLAALLAENGLQVYSELELDQIPELAPAPTD